METKVFGKGVNKIEVIYDDCIDILIINGVKFSRHFFKVLEAPKPITYTLTNKDGIITFERATIIKIKPNNIIKKVK